MERLDSHRLVCGWQETQLQSTNTYSQQTVPVEGWGGDSVYPMPECPMLGLGKLISFSFL